MIKEVKALGENRSRATLERWRGDVGKKQSIFQKQDSGAFQTHKVTYFWCAGRAHTLTQIHTVACSISHENSRVQRNKVTGRERPMRTGHLQPERAVRRSGNVEINRQLFFTTLQSLFLDSWMKWSLLIFPQQKEALRSTEHTSTSVCSHLKLLLSQTLSHMICCLIVQMIYINIYIHI